MSTPSLITTDLVADPPVTASSRFTAEERAFVDNQIRGCQQHLSDLVLNGTQGTYARAATTSAPLQAGDVVCLAGSTLGYPTVTLATPSALAAAGSAYGVVLLAAAPGARVMLALLGVVGPSVTGLAASSGMARVSSAGRVERVSSYSTGDFPLGTVDAQGYTTIQRGPAVGASGGSVSNVTGTAPIAVTGTTTKAVAITPADGSNAGSMSAAHYAQLEAATSDPTESTLVERDVIGGTTLTRLALTEDAAASGQIGLPEDFSIMALDSSATARPVAASTETSKLGIGGHPNGGNNWPTVHVRAGTTLAVYVNDTLAVTIGSNGAIVAAAPIVAPTYAVGSLPSAVTYAGGEINVSNETGGYVRAFSDGTNWRRVTDRAIVS